METKALRHFTSDLSASNLYCFDITMCAMHKRDHFCTRILTNWQTLLIFVALDFMRLRISCLGRKIQLLAEHLPLVVGAG